MAQAELVLHTELSIRLGLSRLDLFLILLHTLLCVLEQGTSQLPGKEAERS